MANGYYYAAFSEVDIQCYDPPSGANVQGSKSYIYTNAAGTNNTVEVTNDNTVLKSLLGTGTNMSASYPSAASASGSAATSNVATIPGLSGAGPGTNGQRGDASSSVGSPSGTSSAGGSASSGGFMQGNGGDQGSSAPPRQEAVLQGSFFAVLVAIIGLLVL